MKVPGDTVFEDEPPRGVAEAARADLPAPQASPASAGVGVHDCRSYPQKVRELHGPAGVSSVGRCASPAAPALVRALPGAPRGGSRRAPRTVSLFHLIWERWG